MDHRGSISSFVYLLGRDGNGGSCTCVGWTNDLDRRLDEHNAGIGARSTRDRQWSLLHAERHHMACRSASTRRKPTQHRSAG
ncbi:MAG: GIY-YIG nuclease family protein [Magnetococcus sp. YQC-3]